MLIVPLTDPVTVGLNVTLIVQFAPAATELPQVLVSPYCALAKILVMLSAALPLLFSVTVCAALVVFSVWLANVKLAGDKLTAGVPAAPVPARDTVCGLPVALSVMVMVPVCVPVAVGVNVTLIVQLPPAAADVPHVFV